MSELNGLSNEELLKEYKETVAFRAEESLQGQVTPHEMKYRKSLEKEILERLK